ncbi:copper transport protein ctr4 [Truncatella angustata]|uniref:Copper transport protein n=1 Tax=Truncatella angustata TaxID=152316 RepID=A0A9P8ZWS0_9PEZI|nr:copper transport protein ctr4 [Truncatella angustata]KAH6652263.1 copper transport protein ctr4 [Truncatella angustata]
MDMSSSTSNSTCQVSMLWNWYTIDACFLAEGWHITTRGMFAATCIGVILLGVLLEFLRRIGKEYDALILRQFQRHIAAQTALASSKKEPLEPVSCCAPPPEDEIELAKPGPRTVTFRATPLQQLIRSVIHAVTFGVAYIIMLLAMYFNGYIIICIIIGAGIGKFVCDWMVHKVVIGLDEATSSPSGIDETTVCCG